MSINFDGTDDYLNCGSSATVDNIFDAGGSFVSWINITTLPADGASILIGNKNFVSGWFFAVSHFSGSSANVLDFYKGWTADGRWRSPGGGFTGTTGTWKHVAVTYNGNSSLSIPIFYIDGTSVAVTAIGSPTGVLESDAAANLEFSYSGVGSQFNGRLEDARIYSRILLAQEIAVLAGGYRGPMGGEQLWVSAHGPNGNLTTGTANVFDMSGNGNHGTPQGGSSYIASFAPRSRNFKLA